MKEGFQSSATNERVTSGLQHLIDIPVSKSRFITDTAASSLVTRMQQTTVRGGQPKASDYSDWWRGRNRIGKNMNAIEYDDEDYHRRYGLSVSGSDFPGINYITPDITSAGKRISIRLRRTYLHTGL